MPKFVNTVIDLAASGLEVTAIYVSGAAPIAPICKLCLILAPVIFALVRSSFTSRKTQEIIHVE